MTTTVRRVLLAGRAIVAVAILAAIVGQLDTSITFWTARGDASIPLDVANFFSFFTIQANLITMLALVALVVAQLRRRRRVGRLLDVVLLCATTYMVVMGLVYSTLLRDVELQQGATLGWANEVLHHVAPLWMLIDWLLSARKRAVRYRDLGIVVVFPVLWLVYTLARGPVTPNQVNGRGWWYPYPFLDPAIHTSGYASVAIVCMVIAAVVMLSAAVLVAYALWRGRASGRLV
ncbi:Pr6Pr family membrane protein [Agrococcus citreus]|uniref:Pr6Pr family membrane protein n=1 Tax=Agrococcus citreus TaxID=84643 RepID=A0ABP4JL48_9MICO